MVMTDNIDQYVIKTRGAKVRPPGTQMPQSCFTINMYQPVRPNVNIAIYTSKCKVSEND